MERLAVLGLAGAFCVLAVLLLIVAWNDETFRAWTYGQAAAIFMLAALVVLKAYEVWRR